MMVRIRHRPMPTQHFIGTRPNPRKLLPWTNEEVPVRMKPARITKETHRVKTKDGWKLEESTRYAQGGFWTSTRRGATSAWGRRRQGNEEPGRHWLLDPVPAARILEVDSRGDFSALMATYPCRIQLPQYQSLRDFVALMVGLDFEKMLADGFDGLHVTERGIAGSILSGRFLNLSSWDVESTVWFRWVFENVRPVKASGDAPRS